MPEITRSRTGDAFDQLYGKLRLKEGRLFSDEDIPYLPQVHSNHPYHKEWVIRKHSCKALINYITKKISPTYWKWVAAMAGFVPASPMRSTRR